MLHPCARQWVLHPCTSQWGLHSCTSQWVLHLCTSQSGLHSCTSQWVAHCCTSQWVLHHCSSQWVLHPRIQGSYNSVNGRCVCLAPTDLCRDTTYRPDVPRVNTRSARREGRAQLLLSNQCVSRGARLNTRLSSEGIPRPAAPIPTAASPPPRGPPPPPSPPPAPTKLYTPVRHVRVSMQHNAVLHPLVSRVVQHGLIFTRFSQQ